VSNDIHALSGAYVLDAVSDTERAAFSRHLDGCDTCALEVAELRETAARLADGTWSAPPPRLRENVLAEVRRTRQAGPFTLAGRAAGYRRWRRLAAGAAAAVVLAFGAGTATYVVQEQRLRDERAATAQARAQTERIRAVLAAPDATVHTDTVSGGGRLTVVFSDQRDAGVVVLDGLTAGVSCRAYQLWLIAAGVARAARVLPAGASSATTLIDQVRGAGGFAVTVEPAGGSVKATTSAVVVMPLR